MKRLWVILFVVPLFTQDINKHNISLGMFDDKTGLSFISYTYNIKQTEMDEFFIGGGTMIVGFTGTAGWKHYYKNSKLSFYSVLSGQAVAHFGFAGLMPTGSFSLEYNLSEKTQVKIGGMGLMLLGGTSGESGSNIGLLPFIGLNFRF
jgi:hypothetical protein|tara:strand:- start:1498 stop:1941 length:444 start_codon:yes stop_codon:yes gene_type:complete